MLLHQVSPPISKGKDNLSLVLEELDGLSNFAQKLFEDLEQSLTKSSQRIAEVSENCERIRLSKLQNTLQTLKQSDGKELFRGSSNTKQASDKRYKPTKGFGTDVTSIFKERPSELEKLRSECVSAPDFSVFDSFVPDAKCGEKFSFPGFFFQEWSRTEEAKNEQEERKMREEKERKKRDKEKKKREMAGDISLDPAVSPRTPQPRSPPQARASNEEKTADQVFNNNQQQQQSQRTAPRPASTAAIVVSSGTQVASAPV
jgi:hypothetical protein